MAKKRIEIEIGAKDKTKRVLAAIGGRFKKFGANMGRVLRFGAVGIAAITASLVALGTKAVKVFGVQEKAEEQLKSAMLAHGDAVDELLPKYKALASAIQDETGVGDESTLALMAKLRTISVANENMERAVKLTLALTKAGMREKTAYRAAADAINGNTTALTTYLPELRKAKTQAEKMAIVNDVLARGYNQMRADLNTVDGRMKELKGRIGDVVEEIGRAISGGLSLRDTLARLSDRIKRFGESERFKKFLDRVEKGTEQLRQMVDIITSGGEGAGAVFASIGNVIKSAFGVGAERVANVLKSAAPEIGRLIGSAIAMVTTGAAGRKSVAFDEVKRRWQESGRYSELSTLNRETRRAARRDWNAEKEAEYRRLLKLDMEELASGLNIDGLTNAEAGLAVALEDLNKTLTQYAPTTIMPPVYGKTGQTGGGGQTGGAGVAGDDLPDTTSMIGIGELFTMMQTGRARQTEVEILNQQYNMLVEIRDAVKEGGLE